MKLQLPLFLLYAGAWSSASALTPSPQKVQQLPRQTTTLNAKHEIHESSSNLNVRKSLAKAGTSFAAASTIIASAFISDMAVAPAPALADVEISRGAFILQTATTKTNNDESSSIVKTEIDSKRLVKTLFANRKDLTASIGRIQTAVSKELGSEPVWMELQKELLNIEGDLSSAVKITPPADWGQTVKDITSGKVNFLLNGEIFNVNVEPNFSKTQDDLVIRVKGFKGEGLPGTFYAAQEKAPAVGPIRAKLEEYKAFWQWLDEPYPTQYLPMSGMQASNGGIILAAAAGSVGSVYMAAYVYHLNQIEQEKVAAEAKQAKAAERATLQKQKQAEQAAKNEVGKKEKAAAQVKQAQLAEQVDKEVEQAAEQADDKMRVEILKADEKEQAKKTEAGDENANDKKGSRLRFRFWKKA